MGNFYPYAWKSKTKQEPVVSNILAQTVLLLRVKGAIALHWALRIEEAFTEELP